QDLTPPIITACAPNQTVCPNASGLAGVPDFTSGVAASDACTGPPTITQSPAAGAIVASGTTTITLTATDGANTATTSTSFLSAPAITAQPVSATTPMRNGAAFSVIATDASTSVAPLSYQWQTNGVNVANGPGVTGATATTLTLSNLALTMNGAQVRCIVTDCADFTPSSAAILTVTPISGISFDFNTPGQFANAQYNLVGNDWIK